MNDPATSCDTLIIGSGPAGSLAGTVLARKGRSVVCVERDYFPRHVVGESLLPRCNELLDRAGMLEAVERRGYMVKSAATFLRGDDTARFRFADGLAGDRPDTFQVPRDDFDTLLATEARRAGVDVRFGQQVEAVELEPDGASVRVADLEGEQSYRLSTRFVLDCSGYGRVLPRLLDLELPLSQPERIACYCHVEHDDRPAGEAAGDIWICVHPEQGWIWIIPFSNGRTSIGMVCDGETWDARSGSAREKLLAFLREEPNARRRLTRAAVVTPTQVIRGYSRRVKATHGPGWALAGNAAGFLDPVFSSGVSLALETAWLSSGLIDRSLSGQPVDWSVEYDDVVTGLFDVFLAFVHSWYRRDLETVFFAEDQLDRIRRFITSILGGNVLRQDNPLATRSAEGLRQLRDSIIEMSADSGPPA